MFLRPFLYEAGSCASYLFGCGSQSRLAVVDPHVELVDDYLATAVALGAPIEAVFETHVQADHVSGLPSRSRTATSSSSETPSSRQSRRPAMLPRTMRMPSPIAAAARTSPGLSSAVTLC